MAIKYHPQWFAGIANRRKKKKTRNRRRRKEAKHLRQRLRRHSK